MAQHPLLNFRHLLSDFRLGITSFGEAIRFARQHHLWSGFWRYGWLSRILLVFAILAGLKFGSLVLKFLNDLNAVSSPTFSAGMSIFVEDILADGGLFLFGGMKYIVLVLGEVLIFHMVRMTLTLLTGEEQDSSFSCFVRAQIRMIKVVIYAWVMELLIRILLSVVLGIASLDFLVTPFMFVVQFYYLGFAVLDNYNEVKDLSIRASARRTLHVAGAAVAVGGVTYLLMLIPLVGPLLAPMLAAIAGTLLMYEREQTNRLPQLEATT